MDETKVILIVELDADITNDEIEEDQSQVSFTIYECNSCHWRFVGDCDRYGYGYTSESVQTPNYCPMCGKKIVGEISE